jgi:hypothetical protein
VLADRWASGYQLWHPEDNRGDQLRGARKALISVGNFRPIGSMSVPENVGTGRTMATDPRAGRVEKLLALLTPKGQPIFAFAGECWLLAGRWKPPRKGLDVQLFSAWACCQVNRHAWVDVDLEDPGEVWTTCGNANCFNPRHLQGTPRLRVLRLQVRRFRELAGGVRSGEKSPREKVPARLPKSRKKKRRLVAVGGRQKPRAKLPWAGRRAV